MKPFIIAIAGASGAGKSYLAAALAANFEPGTVSTLSIDSYYRDLPHLTFEERCAINFDHPDSIDEPLLAEQIEALSRGEAVDKPAYDFAIHRRAPGSEPFAPSALLIVEGIFALCFPSLRSLANLRVYVDTADPECYGRRLTRDTAERGRTADSVERQYQETVRPMAAEFVWPTREFADLRVSGVRPVNEAVEAINNFLSSDPSSPFFARYPVSGLPPGLTKSIPDAS